MTTDKELRVRETAYRIWEQEGHPDGQADRHWQMAEAELVTENGATGSPTSQITPDAAGIAPVAPPASAAPATTKKRESQAKAEPEAKPKAKPGKRSAPGERGADYR